MARTKVDQRGGAFRKVLVARAPRKALGSSTINAGPSLRNKRGGKRHVQLNRVCVRPLPAWQKGISDFLKLPPKENRFVFEGESDRRVDSVSPDLCILMEMMFLSKVFRDLIEVPENGWSKLVMGNWIWKETGEACGQLKLALIRDITQKALRSVCRVPPAHAGMSGGASLCLIFNRSFIVLPTALDKGELSCPPAAMSRFIPTGDARRKAGSLRLNDAKQLFVFVIGRYFQCGCCQELTPDLNAVQVIYWYKAMLTSGYQGFKGDRHNVVCRVDYLVLVWYKFDWFFLLQPLTWSNNLELL
ncbi:hypothetical protein TURU_006719 [Turdus rufiventris]|nr:hypothetical protein TURU_006719 [Turdus rufiventris]